MQIFGQTDIGKVRHTNQDAYCALKLTDDSVLALVCDGMGGANAGNVASETAVNLISEYFINSYRSIMNSETVFKLLNTAITSANINIYDMSLKNPELTGMGTTVVAAFVRDDFVVICHVGDSRAYLINDDGISQLTRDHSIVQSLVESGKITPEEAKVHPRKNIITRALGTEENIVLDFYELSLKNGDTVLLCTDGLTNFVDSSKILNIFKNNDICSVAQNLVDTANLCGGGDNVTVVTVTKQKG